MSKQQKRRFIKFRYVQRNDENPDKLLNYIAEQFPKANLEIDLDRLPKEELDIQRDTKLEEKAVTKGNTVLDEQAEQYAGQPRPDPKFKGLKTFFQKVSEGGTIAFIAEVVKTFFTKTP